MHLVLKLIRHIYINGKVDKLDADKTNNLSQIGAAKVGYGTFVVQMV